ncbi:MAG: threonine synthase [Anaerolineales bacterium]
MPPWPGVIRRYAELLDLPSAAEPITLLEGNTPLVPIPRLAQRLSASELYVKFEGLNPTGSFKDRGMTAAMTEAVHRGAKAVICASTGNTAASAAAYAARAGVPCYVVIPKGHVAAGKLAGAVAYGACVLQIEGAFDAALDMVRKAAEAESLALVNSVNPFRLEGQKTVAFEICDTLGRAPDWLALPVGNAGNITAAWMGFRQHQAHAGTSLPRLLGVQADGASPLVLGHPVDSPETLATAIRIGRPARGDQALAAARESGGRIVAVSDQEILKAQTMLAAEGLWVEPASAAGLAGLMVQTESGELDLKGSQVAIICTGHGLKDPEIITDHMQQPKLIPATDQALADALEL